MRVLGAPALDPALPGVDPVQVVDLGCRAGCGAAVRQSSPPPTLKGQNTKNKPQKNKVLLAEKISVVLLINSYGPKVASPSNVLLQQNAVWRIKRVKLGLGLG